MTTAILTQKINTIRFAGHGTYSYTVEKSGATYRAITHDMVLIDRIKDNNLSPLSKCEHGYTLRQALLALYNNS